MKIKKEFVSINIISFLNLAFRQVNNKLRQRLSKYSLGSYVVSEI